MFNHASKMIRLTIALALMLAFGVVAVAAQGDQTVTSPNGAFTMTTPAGWGTKTMDLDGFSDSLVFASDPSGLARMAGTATTANFIGILGLVGQVDPALSAGQPPAILVPVMGQVMVGIAQSLGATVTGQPTPRVFGGQYNGSLTTTDKGYVAVFADDKEILVVVIISNSFAADQAVMTAFLDNIVIGGAGSQPSLVPTPSGNTDYGYGTTDTGSDTTETLLETETFRSSDQRVSLDLPTTWTVNDHIADQNTLAYGDSEAAAQSRLASARPDLAQATPMTGSGGLVILYPAASFGIDPNNPNLAPLMTQALAQLKAQRYTTEAPEELEGTNGGLYAYIEGAEVGYLALIPFGDQIAYVTATGTADTFDDNEDGLWEVLQSVQSPAAPESTTGLSGLGGLASPEPAQGGLGGLGGLSSAPAATATTPALGGLSALDQPAP